MGIVLEDGGSTAAFSWRLQRRHWMVGAAEEYAMMALAMTLALTSSKSRAYYYGIGITISKDGKREHVRCKGHTLTVMERI